MQNGLYHFGVEADNAEYGKFTLLNVFDNDNCVT